MSYYDDARNIDALIEQEKKRDARKKVLDRARPSVEALEHILVGSRFVLGAGAQEHLQHKLLELKLLLQEYTS